jgi:large subunit ribosomal protein L13
VPYENKLFNSLWRSDVMKTYSTKISDIEREWHVIDASDKVLGRLATRIAGLLMGKHKPIFSRHLDTGDFVVVINADKVRITGNKAKQKFYYKHSGYPGGLKAVSLEKMMQTNPTRVIENVVKGMLPHSRLGNSMIKKLRVYAGDSHPHQAQIRSSSSNEGE